MDSIAKEGRDKLNFFQSLLPQARSFEFTKSPTRRPVKQFASGTNAPPH